MAQKNRGAIGTDIVNEINDHLSKVATYIPTNNNKAIKALDHRTVEIDFNQAVELLSTDLNDSCFNILTDTSDVIIEGVLPNQWFFSEAHFIFRLENQADTDNLDEGTANLYYTNARADARINALRPEQGAIANLALTASGTYSQAQIQAIADKIDVLLAALRVHNAIA
jgi:hypothetical protein